MQLSDRERRIRRRLRDDFTHYAAKCLKIRTKAGSIESLRLNAAQRRLHEALEAQRQSTGRVRALVLKGRQMGISTYIAGRFFWRATHGRGLRAFILTHRDDATTNLFAMAKRLLDNVPSLVRPLAGKNNANELSFNQLDSGYRVGTAKAKGVGRSDTIQLFHGSEVAFWANAKDHAGGALQAVPNEDGTEVLLESTANGMGGLFYDMWGDAEAGRSEFLAVFLGWFIHDEYRESAPAGWEPSGEWLEYAEAHGLDRDQVFWAVRKNQVLGGSRDGEISWLFRQEYPATAAEAFQTGGGRTLISAEMVALARRQSLGHPLTAPLILGVDVAGGGADETAVIDRRGRTAGQSVYERWETADQMEIAGRLAQMTEQLAPDAGFIDVTGGYGRGVYDRLIELGHSQWMPVQFGGRPLNRKDYLNKRAEIWALTRDWLKQPGGADIPDDEVLARHLLAPGWKTNSSSQLVLESKDDIRERLGFSPDAGDALALTFAFPVGSRQAGRPQIPGRDSSSRVQVDYDPFARERL